MTIEIFNVDNTQFESKNQKYNLIFADYVYEDTYFDWVDKYWNILEPNSIFIAMTDYNSSIEFGYYMKNVIKGNRVCKYVWKNEWGQHPKNRPHECYDEIFVYSNGKDWTFNSEKIQVPKATANTKLNPSGRMTKTATAWIDDCTLTTTSKERVKKKDGHLAKWQKPQSLYGRIIAPYLKTGDFVLDIFMGVGTMGLWCKNNNFDYCGIEYDKEVYELASKNIFGGNK